MTRRDAIPTDLVMEILSRLPAKSIARCLCVSKQWGSMLLSPYITELFLTKLSPRLLFAGKRFDDWCFFTSPQLQNLDEKPSSLTADFHMKFPQEFCGSRMLDFCGHASGFILFRHVPNLGIYDVTMPLLGLCNPSTGQYASLPRPKSAERVVWRSFIGFDPIDKQFKVLLITEKEEPNQILTLGTGNDSWREIHCPLNHSPVYSSQGICINGVLYYLATQKSLLPSLIVCFDVRSEKFKFIYGEDYKGCDKLVNYKGELGMISFEYGPSSRYPDRYCFDKLRMWVIKDVEDLEWEWLECFSFCWADELYVDECYFSIIGVTATGEIVLSNKHASEPFYVIYINQEKNTIQKVEIKIQGLRADDYQVEVFADYVENLNFITMLKTRKCNSVTTSTSSKAPHPQQNGRITFESTNKFDSLRLLDDDECT